MLSPVMLKSFLNRLDVKAALFFLFLIVNVYPQNSLYLVDTLTGTAANNKLWKAEGIGDFNGDGYADFIVCYSQYIDLYFGNAQFKPQLAHRFYLPPSSEYFQGVGYEIGDVNGDGFADLMIITGDTTYNKIYPYGEIIFGGTELDTIPKFKYYPPYYWNMLMSNKIYPLGDLNADGYNDFAIASYYNWDDGIGRVYIFKGGKTLIDTPWVIQKGTKNQNDFYYGYNVLGTYDLNGDGVGDFLISNHFSGDPNDSSSVYLYLGSKDSISITPFITYGTFNYVVEIKSAGNLIGNGRNVIIISADGKAFIYLENDNPIIYNASKTDIGGQISIGTGGDINGDGYNDFLVGNTNYRNKDGIMVGDVVGFWGNKTLDTSTIVFKMEGDRKWFGYGAAIDIVGDINDDGYADVFILQPSYCKNNIYNYDSTLGKLYIYSYIKITSVNNNKNILRGFQLNQNFPNPFNPSTAINFQLSVVSYVTLKVYNSLGQQVAMLVDNEIQPAGAHKQEFNANKYNLSSGVYFLELEAVESNSKNHEKYKEVIKMVYLK